jgi:hypothetical protein
MPPDPPHDPIVDEVRRHRERLVRDAGGSLDALCRMLEEREAQGPHRTVTLRRGKGDAPGPGDSASGAA